MAQLLISNQKKYLPTVEVQDQGTYVEPIFFHGDALTEERARNVQWTFKDGDNTLDRLEGLEPLHTDWHAKLKLYDVSASYILLMLIYMYPYFQEGPFHMARLCGCVVYRFLYLIYTLLIHYQLSLYLSYIAGPGCSKSG